MQMRDELNDRIRMLNTERRELLTEAALSAMEGILSADPSASDSDIVFRSWEIAEAFVREMDARIKR